ncbi:MAG TPA: hypothetical protein VJ767_11700 [Nitrososphaeraceae archaeon]|nr:hypothetical protein [Nitrososphaeraceae archaeon]
MKGIGTSERYQNNNLKAIIAYSKSLEPSISFYQIREKNQIFYFLDTKIKSIEEYPDKRWITTRNDYLVRIKYFFRWMYNCKDKTLDDVPFSEWKTPDFVQIKKKSTKRISAYLESELWERERYFDYNLICNDLILKTNLIHNLLENEIKILNILLNLHKLKPVTTYDQIKDSNDENVEIELGWKKEAEGSVSE